MMVIIFQFYHFIVGKITIYEKKKRKLHSYKLIPIFVEQVYYFDYERPYIYLLTIGLHRVYNIDSMSNRSTEQLSQDAMERLAKLREEHASTPLIVYCITLLNTLGVFFSSARSEEEDRQRRPETCQKEAQTDEALSNGSIGGTSGLPPQRSGRSLTMEISQPSLPMNPQPDTSKAFQNFANQGVKRSEHEYGSNHSRNNSQIGKPQNQIYPGSETSKMITSQLARREQTRQGPKTPRRGPKKQIISHSANPFLGFKTQQSPKLKFTNLNYSENNSPDLFDEVIQQSKTKQVKPLSYGNRKVANEVTKHSVQEAPEQLKYPLNRPQQRKRADRGTLFSNAGDAIQVSIPKRNPPQTNQGRSVVEDGGMGVMNSK